MLSEQMREEMRTWCGTQLVFPKAMRLWADAARLRAIGEREWLRGLDKQDPAEGGTSAGSTDLHSVTGSFGGCFSQSGTR